MEARGQPWVLLLVVIHLVLCVCFYELVSHWLIWSMPIMTAWLAREPKRSSCLTSPVLGLQVTATSPSFSYSDPGHQTQVLVITQQAHYWLSYPNPAPSYNIIPLKFMFSVHPSCPLPHTVCMSYALFLTHGSRSIPFLVAMTLRWTGIFLYSVTDSPSTHSMGLWLFRGASCLN